MKTRPRGKPPSSGGQRANPSGAGRHAKPAGSGSKLWQGRIGTAADPLFEAFTSSAIQDQRLAPYDIQCSQAHARALAQAEVIAPEVAVSLVAALDEIADEIRAGTFTWKDELEDVHTHVEARLRDKVGALADSLHAGRSRNDQIAADVRLFVMHLAAEIGDAIVDLQASMLDLARRYRDSTMPGYTHLQQAQPVSIALPLLAYGAMLGRDWERLHEVGLHADRSPLGSGALAGATFPLDRQLLAREAGFDKVAANSLDAVSDRDFLIEFVFVAGLCMTHLSRFGEDLMLWSSTEFGFVRLPDAFSSGSSMMPQKKNPDVAELVRGKTALVLGDVTATLGLVKGLPLGYNRDLQEDKTPLYHAADTLLGCLRALAAMVPHLEFDVERTEGVISSFALATDLADHLVRAGVPFREAHGIVGGLVAGCVEQGRTLADLTPEELRSASPHFDQVPELTAAASIRRKRTSGSTHPDEIERLIEAMEREIEERGARTPSPPAPVPPGERGALIFETSPIAPPSPLEGEGGWGGEG